MNLSLENWCALPTPMGEFRMYDSGDEYVRVVCRGALEDQGSEPLLRVHSSCLASEVFGALDCDCADQMRESMKLIAMEGRGMIVHLHQEGRGQGLSQKIRAVRLMQRDGLDTVQAFHALNLEQDTRSYDQTVHLLRRLGIAGVRLICNNPRKARYLEQHGVRVTIVPTHPKLRPESTEYLKTKRDKLGHSLQLAQEESPDGAIRFYHSDEKWGELSNFSRHAIYIRDRIWPTVEHFYQSQKFAGTANEEDIRRSNSPTEAKCLARALSKELKRSDWSAAKDAVMRAALHAKFHQHPDLAHLLLRSGDRLLVEHSHGDPYWGDGGDGSGLNRLGRLLMELRIELRLSSQLGQGSSS